MGSLDFKYEGEKKKERKRGKEQVERSETKRKDSKRRKKVSLFDPPFLSTQDILLPTHQTVIRLQRYREHVIILSKTCTLTLRRKIHTPRQAKNNIIMYFMEEVI